MLYALLVMSSLNNPAQFYIYKDLEDCLTQKEQLVKAKRDAHCVRLEEPATRVKDLK